MTFIQNYKRGYCLIISPLNSSGNYADALYHYEKGFKEDLIDNTELQQLVNTSPEYEEHVRLCKMGIARTSIRAGDFRRGVNIMKLSKIISN